MFVYYIPSYPINDDLQTRVLALAKFLNMTPDQVKNFQVARFLQLEMVMNYVAFFGA